MIKVRIVLSPDLHMEEPMVGRVAARYLISAAKRVVKAPYLFDLDPNALTFSETGQNTTPYRGDVTEAILVYERSDGALVVLDGHHRTLHAREHGKKKIRAIVMPESDYLDFKREGLHQAEMKRAFARLVADRKRQGSD